MCVPACFWRSRCHFWRGLGAQQSPSNRPVLGAIQECTILWRHWQDCEPSGRGKRPSQCFVWCSQRCRRFSPCRLRRKVSARDGKPCRASQPTACRVGASSILPPLRVGTSSRTYADWLGPPCWGNAVWVCQARVWSGKRGTRRCDGSGHLFSILLGLHSDFGRWSGKQSTLSWSSWWWTHVETSGNSLPQSWLVVVVVVVVVAAVVVVVIVVVVVVPVGPVEPVGAIKGR